MRPKLAVIGCGAWGKNLVRNLAQLNALVLICDRQRETLAGLALCYPGVKTTDDFSEVLADKDIDAVVISTPAETHYPLAKDALMAGKDVLVEKPMALKLAQGEELVRLAEANSRVLMVGHVLEYHPAVVKLKELINQGQLGNVNYIYSQRLNLGKFRREENILWSFAPHDISVILLLLDEMPEEVAARAGSYLQKGVADVTVTTLSFASGVKGHIFVSWLHPYKEQKLVVVGERRMALFDDLAATDKLLLFNHKIDWVDSLPVARNEDAQAVPLPETEPLERECQHFLQCVASRNRPQTDGANGLRVLQVLEACQESLSRGGHPVAVSRDKDFFVHETSVIEPGCKIGSGTKIWHFSHVMAGAEIGCNCTLGQNSFVGSQAKIGSNVKIQNNVSLYQGVTLEDGVFCGPSAVFTNVINPRSHISRRREFQPTLVRKGATIGANATILCGITIGRYAFVAAGAVVTGDVPDHALVLGVPARLKGWVCHCGQRLSDVSLDCSRCGAVFERVGEGVRRRDESSPTRP